MSTPDLEWARRADACQREFFEMFPEEAVEQPVFAFQCRACGYKGAWLELCGASSDRKTSKCFKCGGTLDLQLSHIKKRQSTDYAMRHQHAHRQHWQIFRQARPWLFGRVQPDIMDEP